MNKLTKYACILTALAGAVACSVVKKHKETMPLPASARDNPRWKHSVPVETVYPNLLSGR